MLSEYSSQGTSFIPASEDSIYLASFQLDPFGEVEAVNCVFWEG